MTNCKHINPIQREDGQAYCLRCRQTVCSQVISSDVNTPSRIVVAQYGGVGSGMSPFAPGSTPGGAGKFNTFNVDVSLDGLMAKTHRPAPVDPERNMEKRLEPFHKHIEEDLIPYHLSQKERTRLKIRKEVRRREKFLADCAKSIDQNSVAYIKEHFKPTPQQSLTMDGLLASRRTNELAAKKRAENGQSEQVEREIKRDLPQRRHVVDVHNYIGLAANVSKHLTNLRLAKDDSFFRHPNRMRGEDDNNFRSTADDDVSGYYKGGYQSQPELTGNMTTTENHFQVDDNLTNDTEAKDTWGGAYGPDEAGAFWRDNYIAEEGLQHPANLPTSILPGVADDPSLSLEQRLEKTNKDKKNQYLPKANSDNRDEYRPYSDEPKGIAEKFDFSGGDMGGTYGGGRFSQSLSPRVREHLNRFIISKNEPVTNGSGQSLVYSCIPNGNHIQFICKHGDEIVGTMTVGLMTPQKAMVHAIDVNESFQRRGIGTELYSRAKAFLERMGVEKLVASFEGSGPVQITQKVFGPGSTRYYGKGKEVSYDDAVRIMDKDFGYTRGETTLSPRDKDSFLNDDWEDEEGELNPRFSARVKRPEKLRFASDEGQIYNFYHGTRTNGLTTNDLEERDPDYSGSLGHGIYMGQNRDTAETYATDRGHVLDVPVRLRNPLRIDPEEFMSYREAPPHGGSWEEWNDMISRKEKGEINPDSEDYSRDEDPDEWQARHEMMGHSSIIPGEYVPPFDVKIGDEWVEIRSQWDLRSLRSYAERAGHDAIIMNNVRGSYPHEEVLVFSRDSIIRNPLKTTAIFTVEA